MHEDKARVMYNEKVRRTLWRGGGIEGQDKATVSADVDKGWGRAWGQVCRKKRVEGAPLGRREGRRHGAPMG